LALGAQNHVPTPAALAHLSVLHHTYKPYAMLSHLSFLFFLVFPSFPYK
jgi:hypothetical protein